MDRDFRNLYRHGFARVAACTLPVTMADPRANAAATLERARHVGEQGAAIALFPELGITGYAIDDLLLQDVLLREVEADSPDTLRDRLSDDFATVQALVEGHLSDESPPD